MVTAKYEGVPFDARFEMPPLPTVAGRITADPPATVRPLDPTRLPTSLMPFRQLAAYVIKIQLLLLLLSDNDNTNNNMNYETGTRPSSVNCLRLVHKATLI